MLKYAVSVATASLSMVLTKNLLAAKADTEVEDPNSAESILNGLPYYFRVASASIPHIEKRYKGGEDGFSISPSLIVVADGVGGWANRGVDPALFSKQLCSDLQMLHDQEPGRPLKEILV